MITSNKPVFALQNLHMWIKREVVFILYLYIRNCGRVHKIFKVACVVKLKYFFLWTDFIII